MRLELLSERGIGLPSQPVVITDPPLYQVWLHDPDGRLVGGAGLLADPTTGAVIAVYDGHEHRVFADLTRIVLHGDGFVRHRTFAMADLTPQSLPGKTVLDIDHRQTHARILDVFERRIERACGTRLFAGDIRTHVAGYVPGREIGCTDGDRLPGRGQFQRVVWAGPHTLPTFDAFRIEIHFIVRARWPQRIGLGTRLLL